MDKAQWRAEWLRAQKVARVHLAINSGVPAWMRLMMRRALTPRPQPWFTLRIEP